MVTRALPLDALKPSTMKHSTPRSVVLSAALVLVAVTIIVGLYIMVREPGSLLEAVRIGDPFGLYFATSFIVAIGAFVALLALCRKVAAQ